jgi:lysophospholipase L1-like esterase
VVTLGDSVAYDADPGIRAALEAILTETGVGIEVDTRSFGGVGLVRPGFDDYLSDALGTHPDVITLMLGGWDFDDALADPDSYRSRADQVARRITDAGVFLVWIGLPPTPPGEGIEEHRNLVNDLVASVVGGLRDAGYVTGSLLGDSSGAFTRAGIAVDGTLQQVRKIRDGNDDGHLCPAGAALLGEAVAELLKTRHVVGVPIGGPQVGHPQGEWWTGEWTLDPRYDDPPGGCAG